MMGIRSAALVSMLLLFCSATRGQIFTTLKGLVHFSSKAKEESIEAYNYSVAAQLIFPSGMGQFIIPVRSFTFMNALMEEHFNENYMDADQYPRATYKYELSGADKVDVQKPGQYSVLTKGVMTIKNKSRLIEVPGQIIVMADHSLRLVAEFTLVPADYEIEIPRLLDKKIAKLIVVSVAVTLNKK